jgi:hypothetical protein
MGKNQDPGSGINIPDPQHCIFDLLFHARIIKTTSTVIYLFTFSTTLGKSIHFWKPDPDLLQSPNSGAEDSYSGAVEGIFVDFDPD